MASINNCILATTLHDPKLVLMKLMEPILPIIKNLFLNRIICCTPTTGEKVRNLLQTDGFEVITGFNMNQVNNYKLTIQKALDYIKNSKIQKIFYIDFDRLIHWVNIYPDELSFIVKNPIEVDYLHLGRTSRAFETHPLTQKETEGIINEIGSKILGFSEIKDIISVCFIISKQLGEYIISLKNKTIAGFYSSWPIIFWNLAESKKYIEVEGLEWETPDQFKEEINELGYENWVTKFQSASEWKRRVKLLHEGLIELSQLSDFTYRDKFK
jgi:hypothetical protein